MDPSWDGYNSLDPETHKTLAVWAADCAEHVLSYFEDMHPDDDRPRTAIEATRAWVRGELTVGEAITISRATHKAAREADSLPACEAARAAGHAVATAHVDGHATGAANYAIKAVIAAADAEAGDKECAWQTRKLPPELREVVTTD